jgi:hypothetical protein
MTKKVATKLDGVTQLLWYDRLGRLGCVTFFTVRTLAASITAKETRATAGKPDDVAAPRACWEF